MQYIWLLYYLAKYTVIQNIMKMIQKFLLCHLYQLKYSDLPINEILVGKGIHCNVSLLCYFSLILTITLGFCQMSGEGIHFLKDWWSQCKISWTYKWMIEFSKINKWNFTACMLYILNDLLKTRVSLPLYNTLICLKVIVSYL